MVAGHRDRHPDRRPDDALDPPDAQQRGRHRRARVPCADHRVGASPSRTLASARSAPPMRPSCVRTPTPRAPSFISTTSVEHATDLHAGRAVCRRAGNGPRSRLRRRPAGPRHAELGHQTSARRHSATISPGAWSPPIASTATVEQAVTAPSSRRNDSWCGQSTSRTWRPRYHPQLLHTVCGSFTAPRSWGTASAPVRRATSSTRTPY